MALISFFVGVQGSIYVPLLMMHYTSGDLAVFHGPRKLADYNCEGKAIVQNLKQAALTVRQMRRRARNRLSVEKADNSCATEPDNSKNPRHRAVFAEPPTLDDHSNPASVLSITLRFVTMPAMAR
ncbi:MAG: hypothetical protein EXR27_21635 [Betaproteobacteria bacterium]|nr:hypothetical protein [Betaproteobacteria bacterium]